MTKESISHLIEEELSSFSIEENRPIILKFFQALSPLLIDVFQSYVNKDDVAKKTSLLLECYRRNLDMAKQHVVPIHLFSLMVLDRFGNEAVDCNDFQLQQIWSNVSDKLIDISLEVNDT